MVTVIIPSRNRIKSLKTVISSYCKQRLVDEIVIIDDNSIISVESELNETIKNYKNLSFKFITNTRRLGAAKCRLDGTMVAKNEMIVFGEDDAFFGENYVEELYGFFKKNKNVGVVSGLINYMEYNESIEDAEIRFSNGNDKLNLFNFELIQFNPFAYVDYKTKIPITHALFMTTKSLILDHTFDVYYSKGNGYREESDFQLNLDLIGYDNYIINSCKCYHLNKKNVQLGGQRINRIKSFYWSVFYNNYFLDKYFHAYKIKYEVKITKLNAKLKFAKELIKNLFIKGLIKFLK